MVSYICMICNEWNKELKAFEINFLYNDKCYRGLPICLDCIILVENIKPQFNYEPERIIPKDKITSWL